MTTLKLHESTLCLAAFRNVSVNILPEKDIVFTHVHSTVHVLGRHAYNAYKYTLTKYILTK